MTITIIDRQYLGIMPFGSDISQTEIEIENWDQVHDLGLLYHDVDSGPTVAVFVDFQCPFCARFHTEVLTPFLAQYPDAATVRFVHLPLAMHEFSRDLAHAVECANAQGKLAAFVEQVYAGQEQLIDGAWREWANVAGISDRTAFDECLDGQEPVRIPDGEDWAERVGVTATPSIVIDGWLLPSVPTDPGRMRDLLDQWSGV